MRFHPKWDGPDRLVIAGSASGGQASSRRAVPARVGALSAERTAQIRRRVADGYYATPAMIAELARRIIASGEL